MERFIGEQTEGVFLSGERNMAKKNKADFMLEGWGPWADTEIDQDAKVVNICGKIKDGSIRQRPIFRLLFTQPLPLEVAALTLTGCMVGKHHGFRCPMENLSEFVCMCLIVMKCCFALIAFIYGWVYIVGWKSLRSCSNLLLLISTPNMLFLLFKCYIFETRSHCISLAGLELTMLSRLALNS